MKLSPSVLALFLASVGPAAAADERRLRGLYSVQSEILSAGSCILAARSAMHIPGTSFSAESAAEESLACMNERGHATPITADATQMSSVLEMAASGALRFGETEVDLGGGLQAAADGGVVLASGAEIKVVKNPTQRGAGKRRRGLQAADTLERHFVVFRVTDNAGAVHPHEPAIISNKIFGTDGDQVNLLSQMAACSNGKYTVIPGIYEDSEIADLFEEYEEAPGVVQISIPGAHAAYNFNEMVAAAQAFFADELGADNMLDHFDHAMFVTPAGSYSYAAYAYINQWGQVYQGDYYGMPGVQLHEHGHNLGFAHSGGLDNQAYTDHTCLMGNPLYHDVGNVEVGRMCFNPAKNWQLQLHPGPQVIEGWYDDEAFVEVEVTQGSPRSVKMMGVGEYSLQPQALLAVALKISPASGAPVYVGFNSAAGANDQNDEADNEVTLIQKSGNGYGQSFLLAHLKQGEQHNLGDIDVKATCINVAVTPSVACVCVSIDDEACPPCACDATTEAPTKAPTEAPTKAPTEAPTKAPTANPTASESPVTSPVTSPTPAPVASPDGVIAIDFFHLRFTFSPGPFCFDLDAADGRASGRNPGQCAQACAVLANCVGFVVPEATDTCVMSTYDDFGDCSGSLPNAVFYERSAVMHFPDDN